jgi:hypothetical protein
MKPVRLIEDSGAHPDRVGDIRRMLDENAGSTLDRHLIDPEVWAWDGKVYVFLPGIVVVYDYHEFMAELRESQ